MYGIKCSILGYLLYTYKELVYSGRYRFAQNNLIGIWYQGKVINMVTASQSWGNLNTEQVVRFLKEILMHYDNNLMFYVPFSEGNESNFDSSTAPESVNITLTGNQ